MIRVLVCDLYELCPVVVGTLNPKEASRPRHQAVWRGWKVSYYCSIWFELAESLMMRSSLLMLLMHQGLTRPVIPSAQHSVALTRTTITA